MKKLDTKQLRAVKGGQEAPPDLSNPDPDGRPYEFWDNAGGRN
jgi:hypothetical protein